MAAYERRKWPLRASTTRDVLAHLMDRHDVTGAEIAKFLGGPGRSREAMAGKKSLGFAAVKRLRERFGISADVFDDTIGAEGRKSEA